MLKGTLDEGFYNRQGPKSRYTDSNGNIIVKILLKLDDMKEGCLFEDAEIVYNEYKEKKDEEIEELSRFDLMDI